VDGGGGVVVMRRDDREGLNVFRHTSGGVGAAGDSGRLVSGVERGVSGMTDPPRMGVVVTRRDDREGLNVFRRAGGGVGAAGDPGRLVSGVERGVSGMTDPPRDGGMGSGDTSNKSVRCASSFAMNGEQAFTAGDVKHSQYVVANH
jgi:hypothetical protein